MKTSADIALAAGAITTEQPAISPIDAWALAGAVIDALDNEGRLKAVPVVHRQCEDCRRPHNGPGRICPRCRAAEDGQERHADDGDIEVDVA